MKPLRLVVEGFGSYQKRQEISFQDLTLFAISGSTGSGKSLLLDAMTYALYGQTARLGSRGLDILISPGTSRLMVELEFESGGQQWRVLRTAERKGAAGTVNRNTTVEELRDGTWIRVPDTDRLKEADLAIERITGLDYPAFTRSVLLPQGKFDEFLQGDASSRRALLKSLLGLDVLDRMREEANQRMSDARARIAQLTEQIAGDSQRLEQNSVASLETALAASRQELEALNQALPEKNSRMAALTSLAGLHRDRQRLAAQLAELEEAAVQLPEMEREIERSRAAAGIAELLEAATRARKQQEQAEVALAEASRQSASAAAAESAAVELQLQAAARQTEETPRLQQQLESLQEAVRLAARLKELGGSLEADSEGEFSEVELHVIRQLQAQLPGLERAIRTQSQALEKQQKSVKSSLAFTSKLTSATSSLDALRASGQLARTSHEQADALLRRDQAAHLRSKLQIGDVCPICGNVITSLPEGGGGDTAALIRQEQQAQKELELLRDRYQEEAAALQRLQAEADNAAEAVRTAGENVISAAAVLEESLQPFREAGHVAEATELPGLLEATEAAQLGALARQVRQQAGGEDPLAASRRVRDELTRLADTATSAAAGLSEARARAAASNAAAAAAEAALNSQNSSLAELAGGLERSLQASGFADEDEARQARRDQQTLAALVDNRNRISEGLISVRSRLAEVESGIADRADPAEELLALEAGLQADRTRIGELQTASGRQEQQLQEARERQERIRGQQEELKLAENGLATFTQLNLDLRSNQFLDFLLSGVQQDLALRASHIIRQVTSGRLDLHLGDDGSFEVSDAASAQTIRRPARSLSGGETFMVSLALALALAETVTGSKSLGALFLDEGFGTLDPDLLDQVTGVLENLTLVGRMVGIVTHVQELSERLPARLLVTRTEEGSLAAWED